MTVSVKINCTWFTFGWWLEYHPPILSCGKAIIGGRLDYPMLEGLIVPSNMVVSHIRLFKLKLITMK